MSIKHLFIAAMSFFCLETNAQPGALDPSFGQGGVAVTTESLTRFENILPLANGQFLLVNHETASHTQENGFTESATFSIFRRCNADGTFDLTYGSNGKRRFISSDLVHQYFTGFGRLSDGRIVAIETYGYNGQFTPLNNVWIFNSDGTGGSIIASLSVFGYFSTHLNGITVDSQDRIVVTGWVRGNSGADKNRSYIARLFADGTLDESFNTVGFRVVVENSSYNYSGEQVATDANNNVIIVEQGYYGTAYGYYITKYLENGTHVTAFGNVNANADVRSLITDGNSKIIFLAGSNIKRLNTDGTADITFQSSGISVKKLVVQPDNKVIVAGSGTSNGYSVIKVGRFGTGGSLDPVFGTNGTVTTDLNFGSAADDAIYVNRRLYVSGYVAPLFSYGTVAAYDASDVRMTCPTVQSSYSVDAGKCYATVTGINAVMSSSTLYANVKYKMEFNGSVIEEGEGGVSGKQFQKGTTTVTYTYEDITTQTCSFNVVVYDGDPPVALCKNVTVQLDAAGNGTLTAAQVDNGSTDGCGIKSMTIDKTSFNCIDPASNTVTLTVTDNNDNQSTCTATVTVEDNVPPVPKCKNITVYLDANGNVTITPADVDDGSTDACGIKSYSLDKTTFSCSDKGNNTVTLTVTDNHDNSATCTSTVNVVDNISPVISSVVPTPSAIWPSDRKMKNVTVETSFTDNCPGATCMISSVAIKSGEFAGDNIGPDWEITSANTVNLRAEIPKKGVKRIYTITVTCTDASNNSSTSTTDVVVAHNITSPVSGATVKIGSTVNLSGEFWDVPGNKHSAKWIIDDKTINGTVTEPSGINSGTITGSYKFTNAGVYKVQMNITDQYGITSYGNTSENLEAIVVVYDPNGGYTYGGGWFSSPAGALKSNVLTTGDASYGFTVNYYKGAKYPKGETQFDFKVGDFEFNALNFEYLSIGKTTAQIKGTGKIIGGQSGISFIMTVADGQLDGSGVDKIRMKIYNKNTGAIFYDNQPGASDAALPVTAVGVNSEIFIQSNSTVTSARVNENNSQPLLLTAELEIKAFPNPSSNNFSIAITGNSTSEKIVMQVYDVYGRMIEKQNIMNAGTIVRIGEMYKQGTYFVRIMQGNQHKELKLIKVAN